MNDRAPNRGKSILVPAEGIPNEAEAGHRSLEGMHSSVPVPHHQAGFWQQWRAVIGAAGLVCVGHKDPGQLGPAFGGRGQNKNGFVWVGGLATLLSIFMPGLSARLRTASR